MSAPAKRITALGAACLIAALGGSASAQTLGQAPDDGVSTIRVAMALVFCLLLAGAGALAIRLRTGGAIAQLAPGKIGRRLVLVERIRLSPQVALCLVRCDEREFLVAASPTAVLTLERVAPGTAPPPGAAGGGAAR